MKHLKQSLSIGRIFLYAFLVVFAVIQLYPLLWLLFFSLKSNGEIFGGNSLALPSDWLWSNYQQIISNSDLPLFFMNSVFVTAITVAITILASAMMAYGINRMRWKLSKAVLTLVMTGIMIPLHAALLPLFLVLRDMHMLNSYMALILPYTAFGIPIAVFIFTGFFESIPMSMEEAASIEGASIYRTFFTIIIPLIKPAIATIGIFTFLSAWNELMFAVTFIHEKAFKTLTVGIISLSSQYRTQWGPIGAALVLAVLPALLIYLFLSKNVQDSIRAGAVKG